MEKRLLGRVDAVVPKFNSYSVETNYSLISTISQDNKSTNKRKREAKKKTMKNGKSEKEKKLSRATEMLREQIPFACVLASMSKLWHS